MAKIGFWLRGAKWSTPSLVIRGVRSDGATLTFDIDGTPREVRTADITVAKTPAAIRPENATPHSDHRSENGRKERLTEGDYSFNVVS